MLGATFLPVRQTLQVLAASLLFSGILANATPPAPPAWWSDGNPPVIDPAATASNTVLPNHGVANIGQAKCMASEALRAIGVLVPEIAAQIQSDLDGAAADHQDRIVDLTLPVPRTAAWLETQKAPLLLGQLKAIATPFYQRLHDLAPDWLDHESSVESEKGQLQLNGTKDAIDTANYYPWTSDAGDDANLSPATIGQLKAVFSLRFESSTNTSKIPDLWLYNYRNQLLNQGIIIPPLFADFDVNRAYETVTTAAMTYYAGAADSNNNGIPDIWEAAHAGTFAVYPPFLARQLTRNQSSEESVYLFNDTGDTVNYNITPGNNTVPAYSFKYISHTWEDISTNGGTLLDTVSGADDAEEEINIGFTFRFYGQDFTAVHVGSNGLLTFGAGSTQYNNSNLPSTAAPPNLIAALWDDLNTLYSGDVYYKQEADRLIVQYQNVSRYNDHTSSYTFQVVLFPGGEIQIRYQTLTNLANTCTVGTQNSTRNIGLQIINDAPGLASGVTIDIQPQTEFVTVDTQNGSVDAKSVSVMKATFRSITLPFAAYYANLSISHDGTGSSPQQVGVRLEVADSPGTVTLDSSHAGQAVIQNTHVTFSAIAEDPDGIASVEFYDNAAYLGESTVIPYAFATSTLTAGDHAITAKVIDIYGGAAISNPIVITILADSDGDSMPDSWESTHGLNPCDASDATLDADHDGYTNIEEYTFDKNPDLAEDTDLDEMPDGYEYHHGLNLTANDAAIDIDKDGLTNLEEYRNGTDPMRGDSDGDRLPDGWELTHGLNPLSADGADGADGDIETDIVGSVGDGVSNLLEYLNGTDPKKTDTDGDGTVDQVEITRGSDPADPSDGGNTPDDPVEEVPFKVFGDYASWRMEIQGDGPKDHRKLLVITPDVDVPETKLLILRKNNKYKITLHHTGSKPGASNIWYCWEARVENKPDVRTFPDYSPNRIAGVAQFFTIAQGSWIVDNRSGLFTAHNHRYDAQGGNAAAGLEATLIPVGLVPDYNRDGKIDQADRGGATEKAPWRFWINDDDDSGDVGGTDIPQGWAANNTNGKNSRADGLRDLVDFFPLQVDIKEVLSILPASAYRYRLTHTGSTEDPALQVVQAPGLMPSTSGDYLKSLDVANAHQYDESHPIHTSGPLLNESFLAACASNGGLLLVEGIKPTTSPVVLKIERISDNSTVAEIPFHLITSGVMDMLRYKFIMPGANNLTPADIPGDPPNWPDAERNGKHFVLVHGYNVNNTQSKGWAAELFKRMFWSGSNARFSAFAWYGSQGQISTNLPLVGGNTPNYQENLVNAFGTANSFKQFLDRLEGTITVAAHSMGNILVGSAMHDWSAHPANYFMVNSAAAKECYDASETDDKTQDDNMVHPAWKGYPKALRASEWHHLLPNFAWPVADWRGKLTWKDRFKGVIDNGGLTQVYNFYSSGEEVLNNPDANNPTLPPADPFSTPFLTWTTANKMWGMQEKLKGHGLLGFVFTSTYGGWKPNLHPYTPDIHTTYLSDAEINTWRMKTPSELPALLDPRNYTPTEQNFLLVRATIPFFDDSSHPDLFDPQTGATSPGSIYAKANLNTIISQMIPCTTYAAGRNALQILGGHIGDLVTLGNNIDMDATMKTDPMLWPLSNANENNKAPNNPSSRPWLHSDIKDKAFAHNWSVYDKFVTIGHLK